MEYVDVKASVAREVGSNGDKLMSQHTITVKEEQSGSIEPLVEELNTDLTRLARHTFNINHQYKALTSMKENIESDTVIVHIDFSENYNCKYSSEIKSTHFGASKRQISIHTGVAYFHDRTVSFATISGCLKHGPAAILAHMDPVLKYLRTLGNVSLTKIHFVSDGPTTQYRSKTNFYFFSKKIYDHNFEGGGTWNFWESGHGKGAPDGIGAVIKRQSDALVDTRQHDVMKAVDIVTGLADATSIRCFEIAEDAIEKIEQEIPNSVRLVRNTMKIHQVTSTKKREIRSRILSCATDHCCLTCDCYNSEVTEFEMSLNNPQEGISNLSTECSAKLPEVTTQNEDSVLRPITNVDESLVGQWCVVIYKYDGLPYPGEIIAVYEVEVEVKTMSRIGNNRWFWLMRDDVLWYDKVLVLTLLDEQPVPVTKRHHKLDDSVWSSVQNAIP